MVASPHLAAEEQQSSKGLTDQVTQLSWQLCGLSRQSRQHLFLHCLPCAAQVRYLLCKILCKPARWSRRTTASRATLAPHTVTSPKASHLALRCHQVVRALPLLRHHHSAPLQQLVMHCAPCTWHRLRRCRYLMRQWHHWRLAGSQLCGSPGRCQALHSGGRGAAWGLWGIMRFAGCRQAPSASHTCTPIALQRCSLSSLHMLCHSAEMYSSQQLR